MEIKAEEVRNYQIFEGWAAGCDSKGCPGELDDRKRSPKKADAIKKALEASVPSTQPASTGAALDLYRRRRYVGLSAIRQARAMMREGRYTADCRCIIKDGQRELARDRAALKAATGAL